MVTKPGMFLVVPLPPLQSVNQNVICECKKSTLQSRFVEKYNELKEEGKIEEEKLFEETGKALLASGIILQRRGVDKVSIKYPQSYLAAGLRKLHSQALIAGLV